MTQSRAFFSWGRFAAIQLHPAVIVSAILLGGFVGWLHGGENPILVYLGDIYVRLLQMCVIPLLMTAVILSLSKLFSDGNARGYAVRLFALIAASLLAASTLGVMLGWMGSIGTGIGDEARAVIGRLIYNAESVATNAAARVPEFGLADTISGMVPDNIFLALSSGNKLAILFFAVLFGIALGSIERSKTEVANAFIEALYDTFIKIISWLMYGLPAALFCLAYAHVGSIGIGVISALMGFAVLMITGALFLWCVATLVICHYTRSSPLYVLAQLKDSMFVAIGTSSSFAAIPSAISGLKQNLGVDKRMVDLVVPLGMSLHPPANPLHFGLATVFMANLYGVQLDIGQLLFIVVASTMAGVAAAGAPSAAGMSLISFTLVPLGLPVEVAIILLIAIDPLVDPFNTALNVQANSALAAVMGGRLPAGEKKSPSMRGKTISAPLPLAPRIHSAAKPQTVHSVRR